MRNQKDLKIRVDENPDFNLPTQEELNPPPRRGFTARNLVEILIVLAVILGFLQVRRWQQVNSKSDIAALVQDHIEAEHTAVSEGDGPAFLALQDDNPAWISAQLRPWNQLVMRSDQSVAHVEEVDNFIWAEVVWELEGERLHRIAFYEQVGGNLIHIQTAPSSYWGAQWREERPWGTLVYFTVDTDLVEELSDFVVETVEEICADQCLEDRLPFVLTVSKDFSESAAPKTIKVPSPRMFALQEDGRPAMHYWELVRAKIIEQITPATITFAVAPLEAPPSLPLLDYVRAAHEFMAENPEISIEIIELSSIPSDPAELARNYDGAAVPPTVEMLAAGVVRDLTDFMDTDPTYDRFDYYGQILQGARWRDRTWWVPQAANMSMIFYDKTAFREAGVAEPSMDWTWEDLSRIVETVLPQQDTVSDIQWGFLDDRLDSLYSYTFQWGLDCIEIATIYCRVELSPRKVSAGLQWYRDLVGERGIMPDFSDLTQVEREDMVLQMQGARRRSLFWTARPVNYEHQVLLFPTGVAPFPGSSDYNGIAPLWVYGGYVSQYSDRPLAVWKWLSFLSFQRPGLLRIIPARPSVAEAQNFWGNLPAELGEPMRVAFPYAFPVKPEEQNFLTWTMIRAMLDGEMMPEDAFGSVAPLVWFGSE